MIFNSRRAFWWGVRDGAPFVLVIVPFGMLFGVIASEAGLTLIEALGFSIAVIAGAAQFTAVSLLSEQAPTLVILAASLAVNLRMAMYSASLVPHLGRAPLWQRGAVAYFLVDQTYACAIARYEENADWSLSAKLAYFFGCMILVCPLWYVCTVIGALAGNAVPPAMALDFALPICFLALVAPMLRTRAHVAAAVTAVVLALLLRKMPSGVGLLLAGMAGMAVGAETERRSAP